MPTTTGKIYLGATLVSGGSDSPTTDWSRPADWPAMPAVAATNQVFYGLYAVFDHEANFATIRCQGNYTVNWGDGSAPVDIASNTTAQYNYSFAASGLGPVTSRGYKTAIVTVTPQAGQTLSLINLGIQPVQAGLTGNRSSQWLDIRLAMNNAGIVTTWVNNNWFHRLLERFEWIGGSTTQTSFANFLFGCSALRSVPLFNTGAATALTGFMYNCPLLQTVPLFNTSSCTSFENFLRGSGVINPPLFDTSKGTTFNGFMQSCIQLNRIPLYNTSACTNFNNFLNGSNLLQEVPALDLTKGTNLTNAFGSLSCVARNRCSFPSNLSINFSNQSLGPAALNEIYTNLLTAVGTPTITVTGNWGTTAHTPSIATAKGWTVTS